MPVHDNFADMIRCQEILEEVYNERERQDRRFGEQNHPDGQRGREEDAQMLLFAREICGLAERTGQLTFQDILDEEYFEVRAAKDVRNLREELVQLAAVCVSWVQAIDRRQSKD